MDSKKRTRLIEILRERSYREGDFTLASGEKSRFYIDVKTTSLYPEGAYLIGELAVEKLLEAQKNNPAIGSVRGVGGLTLGADPIGTAVSLAAFHKKIHWPAFIVRKEPKGHGTLKYIEGIENLDAGASVVVLEDVVTTGGSGAKAVERLRAEGFKVVAVLSVVDREQGGEQVFKNMGLPLYSLLKLSDLSKAGAAI